MVLAIKNPKKIPKESIDAVFLHTGFPGFEPAKNFDIKHRQVSDSGALDSDALYSRGRFGGRKKTNYFASFEKSKKPHDTASGELFCSEDKPEILCCENVRSSSKDLNEVYREKQEDFNKYKRNFPLVENQIGNIAVVLKNGRKTLILDIFDRHEILGKYHKNLISIYALEAGLKAGNKIKTNEQEVRGFLDSVDSCDFKSQQPVSAGEDYLISGPNLQGSALLFDGSLAYMNFFTKKRNDKNSVIENPTSENFRDSSGFSSGFYRAL